MTGVPVDSIDTSATILTGIGLAVVDACLTDRTCVSDRTVTREAVDVIFTGSTVLARV